MLDPANCNLSLRQQCELLQINRSSYYYQPAPIDEDTLKLMRAVDEIYTEYPFFGTRMMTDYLKLHGYGVFGRAKIRTIYEHLGLRSVKWATFLNQNFPKKEENNFAKV